MNTLFRFLLTTVISIIISAEFNCLTAQDFPKKEERRHREKNAFGIQIKPIIPSSMFRIVTDEIKQEDIIYNVSPQTGFSAGATIRFGLSPRFIVQTDINYINRNFLFTSTEGNKKTDLRLKIVSYEIPLLLTHFVRLSEEIYMGQTAGFSFQFLPTNLFSRNNDLEQLSLKRRWVSTSAVLNIGFEWRTQSSGYFYFGPTYNMYFKPMYQTRIQYKDANLKTHQAITDLRGDYFGFVFRYIFDPD